VNRIDTDEQLRAATAELIAIEPRFASVVDTHGPPALRRMKGGLPGLLRIVTDQMISLKAGAAIWRRVAEELHPFDPEDLVRVEFPALMRMGLSAAKARTFHAAAEAVISGALDFHSLDLMTDAEAYAALTKLPGIGPWTADIYLLGAMGRTDAWPSGDLALQSAALHLFGLGSRPDARALDELAESWRPWRAAAARLLWSHYRGLKGIPQMAS
jgi:DNA-3-methyladenine glycosylase II